MTARVHVEIVKWLADVRDNPHHSARVALDNLLATLADDLQHDDDTIAKAEALKERFLTHPSVGNSLVSLWGSVRRAVIDALDDPDGELRARLVVALRDLGARVESDDELRAFLAKVPSDVLVVIDEASLVSPAQAVSAIARGEQVVLSGDPQQLRPQPFTVTADDQRPAAVGTPVDSVTVARACQ